MQLLSQKEFIALRDLDHKKFPFCLQDPYLKIYPAIQIIANENTYAPVKLNKIKNFRTLQFQFPPLDRNGDLLSEKKEKEFCEKAILFISENNIAHRIQQPTNFCLFSTAPKNSISLPFGTYRINLQNNSETEILQKMQARYRTALNQVSKLNVSIKMGESELQSFQKLHEATMKRTGAFVESYSTLLKEVKALPNNSLVATVYIDNELQGGLFVLYSPHSAYYFHGASADTTHASGAIKYLHYKIMCLLKEKKVNYYDFVGARLTNIEGTKYEGIQNFKKRFGSELIKGYLWKLDIDKKVCQSYDLLLKIKCKLKGTRFPKDIIDQEKNKALA
jgi:hypothetical protein